jgi:hypothetical protein
MTKIVNLKDRQRRGRRGPLVALDKSSGAGRFFTAMIREIECDLGGRRELSRMESELVRAFAGAATTLQYLNVQVALGESSEIDLGNYATLASTMLRIGSRLGFRHRTRDVTPTLSDYLYADRLKKQRMAAEQAEQGRAAPAAEIEVVTEPEATR